MDELLKLPTCTESDRPNTLRSIYDKINVHVRGLSSLGIDSEQYGGLLVPVIMSKLPQNLRLRMARGVKSSVWKIDELLAVIKTEVEARELSEGAKVGEDRNTGLPRNSPSTAKSLYVKEGNETKIQCVYCGKFHFFASCESVTDPNARRNLLVKSNRCFKCLKVGHQVKNCKHPKNCRNTKEDHDSNTSTGSSITAMH